MTHEPTTQASENPNKCFNHLNVEVETATRIAPSHRPDPQQRCNIHTIAVSTDVQWWKMGYLHSPATTLARHNVPTVPKIRKGRCLFCLCFPVITSGSCTRRKAYTPMFRVRLNCTPHRSILVKRSVVQGQNVSLNDTQAVRAIFTSMQKMLLTQLAVCGVLLDS